MKTVLRWIINNPEYKRRFGLLLTRSLDPVNWCPPLVMVKAIFQGMAQDLKGLVSPR